AEPSTAATAEETPPSETHADPDNASRPSARIRIGTQRADSQEEKPVAEAQIPAAEPVPAKPPVEDAKHYPPPNVRDQLTPDLEAELEAALGGESIDALLDSDSEAAAEEIPEGTRLTAAVAKIYQDNVFIDLGGRNQGVLPAKQFEGKDLPEPGGPIDVVAVRFVADDGLYELSLPGAAVEVGNWDDVEEGQLVEVTVTGSNKGGLECQISGLRGFMPMGQISLYRVENPEEYVGQRINAVVTEANRDRRNLVLSHRAVMEREKAENREKLLQELAPGQMHEGVVRSLRDFGAFVDLGGIDGLIHVSKMSWDRVNHPSEVLTEGQAVKVKIERIDAETGKIGLSYRESAENPWDSVETKYYAGVRVNGTVTKIMDFGAFVKLEPGIEGLIHISELGHGRVFRTGDAVSDGQAVEVKVLSVDREKQRISLSLKALMEPPKKAGDKDDEQPTDFTPPPDAPKAPRPRAGTLKGGTGGTSGGEQFGLKW
ncbi:MAG: S1 RNA-binding domain-containing protein, partial [Aeoliella sp.]